MMTTKRKVRADFDKSQSIVVNVSGCSEDVKKQVQQAFFDVGIKWGADTNEVYINLSRDIYTNTYLGGYVSESLLWSDIDGVYGLSNALTPAEFFAMVYEDEPQGHPHAELMMAYAEDAKTHRKPWKLWQYRPHNEWEWRECFSNLTWGKFIEYRRKPKTHLVHGVEVPDLRIKPKRGESYYYPYSEGVSLVSRTTFVLESRGDAHRLQHNLCYEDTEAGKQAAILHAKIMLGIYL